MAEPPSNNSDPVFANREEDWPDPDVDSSTEEGAEIMRRSEASLFASTGREARDRQRATEATDEDIPWSLYDKARDHQDQLTEAERQRFLSRGDVVAKALGCPDSLTLEETHQAAGWPPPDVARANIQRATGGKLSTPAELFAKMKDAVENGRFDTDISDEEACLVVNNFYPLEDWNPRRYAEPPNPPGSGHSFSLLSRRHGMGIATYKACGYRWFKVNDPNYDPGPPSAAAQDEARRRRARGELNDAMVSAERQFKKGALSAQDYIARVRSIEAELRTIKPSSLASYTPDPNDPMMLIPPGVPLPSVEDRCGSGPWPDSHNSIGGFSIFHRATGFTGMDSANRAVVLWAAMPEHKKEPYRARAEAKRREAWADFETDLARKDAGVPPPPPPPDAPRPSAEFLARFGVVYPNPNPVYLVSAFEVFRDEQVAGDGRLGFREVLAKWEALTNAQRQPYEQRARQARLAATSPLAQRTG